MHVQVGRSPATDRLSHPVHGGRGGAKVHAARLRPASPKIAVAAISVASSRRDQSQESGLNRTGALTWENRFALLDLAPQTVDARRLIPAGCETRAG